MLLKALAGEKTSRACWVPFVGVHGAKLVNARAEDYLKSSKLIIEAQRRAADLYKPDGLPVVFDLQLEAEVLGCDLKWADEVPPSVTSHPLSDRSLEDLPALDTSAGRFPIVKEALQELKQEIGDDVALYGLICGPFTLALHLLGNEIFLEMYDEPDKVQNLLMHCARIGRQTAEFYLENGADVIAVVDPMTSQISPDHFEEFVAPAVNDVFDFIREKGAFSSLFICGDATRVLEAMCETRCDNISVDENISLENLRDLAKAGRKSFGGNLKLTAVLLLGSGDDVRVDVLRCLDAGGTEGFILAPGCDLPYGTPERHLALCSELVHDEYQREVARKRLENYEHSLVEEIKLPDYSGDQDHVYIDVLTLDSEACAPCQYMVEAVNKAAEKMDAPLVIKEHKIKMKTGLAMFAKLAATSIPSICIDGEVKFSSFIPDQKKLIEAIEEKLADKSLSGKANT